MIRNKKNGFWTFCFSLLPGAGEMYLGFMKMGISLMAIFFALCGLSGILNIGVIMLPAVCVSGSTGGSMTTPASVSNARDHSLTVVLSCWYDSNSPYK